MSLTDMKCRNAKPAEKDYKLSDSGRLYLFVRTSGSKLWRMNYVFDGKQKTLSIGTYPTVSLAEARAARDVAKEKLQQGLDPMGKSDVPEDRKFKEIAKAWFAANAAGWVTSYSVRIWARLEDDIFPAFAERDVDTIEPVELLQALRKIEDRGAIEMAKRVRQTVSNVFKYAIAEGKTKNDPAALLVNAMKANPPAQHRSALREEDLPVFFNRLKVYDGEAQTRLAIEVVVHTFVRTHEIRMAEWSEFDFKGKLWRIPEAHMKMRKEHLVPLTDHVIELLLQLKEISKGNRLVVPGGTGLKPISENTMLFGLYRMGYHSKATIHGFRSTASTILNESGLWREDSIERQLAHVPKDEVRAAYNAALYLPERIKMMNWYTDRLLALSKKVTNRLDLLDGLL